MATVRMAIDQKLTIGIYFEKSWLLGSTVIKVEQDRESKCIFYVHDSLQ